MPEQASSEVEACLFASPGTHRHQVPGEASSEVEVCLIAFPGTHGHKVPGKASSATQVGVVMCPAIKCCTNESSEWCQARRGAEPQGSICSLTHAIFLFPQHPPAMDNSSQQEDRIPPSAKHASMCVRPSHAKKIGIGCADKHPVRLESSSRSTGWIESRSS